VHAEHDQHRGPASFSHLSLFAIMRVGALHLWKLANPKFPAAFVVLSWLQLAASLEHIPIFSSYDVAQHPEKILIDSIWMARMFFVFFALRESMSEFLHRLRGSADLDRLWTSAYMLLIPHQPTRAGLHQSLSLEDGRPERSR